MRKSVLAVLLIISLVTCQQAEPPQAEVPEFQLVELKPYALLSPKNLKQGKVSIVNFWASWCLPCRAEHPLLMMLAKQKNIQLVGIAYHDQAENARRFLSNFGNPFHRVGLDQTGFAALGWGLKGVPETFIVNRHGKILFHHRGPLTDLTQLNQALEQARR